MGGTPEASGLRRDLTLTDAVGVGLGAIIGAGIFVVVGVAAGVAGPALLVGLLIAGAAAACNALSSAELAATYPQSGGTYEYGYRLLHPVLGFGAGWMFLVSKLAAGGTVALGFGGYFAALFPSIPARPAALGAVVLLTLANWFGVRKVGLLNTLIVGVTILVLLGFVAAGIPAFDTANLRPFAPRGWRGVAEASALLFFAYTGYARIATLGEEVSRPEQTIPRAIIISLAVSAVLYFAVAVIAIAAVGADAMTGTSSPLQRAAQAFSLPLASGLVAVGATTAMLGVLLSQIVGISRMAFAMARRGDLPRLLARVHPAHGVPHYGILLAGTVILLLALFGTLEQIVAAAAFTILLYYGITNAAALRLAADRKLYPRWVAALGLAFCVAMALSLRATTIAAGCGLLVVGLALRWLLKRESAER